MVRSRRNIVMACRAGSGRATSQKGGGQRWAQSSGQATSQQGVQSPPPQLGSYWQLVALRREAVLRMLLLVHRPHSGGRPLIQERVGSFVQTNRHNVGWVGKGSRSERSWERRDNGQNVLYEILKGLLKKEKEKSLGPRFLIWGPEAGKPSFEAAFSNKQCKCHPESPGLNQVTCHVFLSPYDMYSSFFFYHQDSLVMSVTCSQ